MAKKMLDKVELLKGEGNNRAHQLMGRGAAHRVSAENFF